MGRSEIISETNKTPEERGKNHKHQLSIAAEKLHNDYLSDPELTALSVLDQEDFVLYPNQIERT